MSGPVTIETRYPLPSFPYESRLIPFEFHTVDQARAWAEKNQAVAKAWKDVHAKREMAK